MERKSMIKVRGGFSDRAGIDPCNIQMQIDDFDERTRTFISNKLYDFLQVTFNHECETRNIKYGPTDQNLSNIFCKNLMQNVFADLNHLPLGYHYDWEKFYSRIEEVLMEAPYNEVLDLLWYICNWFALSTNNCIDVFQEWFNELFQSEYVGYRFISGEIVPITDEIEVKEIEQACCTPFDGARKHLKKALNFLSDREHPDYKNCVKESISAVEATCRIIAEKDSATLGEALKLLAKHGLKLHPCLNSGIDKLYSFYEENYKFRIMNNVPFKATSSRTEDYSKLAQSNKYFHGTTHDGSDIAVYCGSRTMPPIRTVAIFSSNVYAIQKGNLETCNWEKIDAIEFRGGTLDSLFFSIDSPYELVNGAVQLSAPKSPFCFSFDYNGSCIYVKSGNQAHETYDLNRVELIGRTRYLTLQFSEPISFGAVPFHIEKIKTLLSFMTFRQNVDFDEIALQEKTSFPPLLMDTALVYSKGSSTVTQKKAPNNICFNDLDVTLSSLIELIYCEQKNNPFSFMNFVPEDDKGLGRVTNDMVKGIVTCLECEIARLKKSDDITSAIQDNKNDTYIQEELRLQSLVKELQKVAKDFQKKNGKFSKKTNDMICGRLKYMTIADADKVCLFYVKYQKFIRKLFDKFEIVPTEDDIQNLIIYRNRTTHGTQAVLDEHIVTTALYLTGLIYCMILHSIGIDDKNLEQLCSRHFLWR